MELYDELTARGLIAQVTDENEIRKMINAGNVLYRLRPDSRFAARRAFYGSVPYEAASDGGK